MLKGIRRVSAHAFLGRRALCTFAILCTSLQMLHVAKAKIGSSEADMVQMDQIGVEVENVRKAILAHSEALAGEFLQCPAVALVLVLHSFPWAKSSGTCVSRPETVAPEVCRTSVALNSAMAALYPTGGPVQDSLHQLGEVAFKMIRGLVGGRWQAGHGYAVG